jgi:hypothetical protein
VNGIAVNVIVGKIFFQRLRRVAIGSTPSCGSSAKRTFTSAANSIGYAGCAASTFRDQETGDEWWNEGAGDADFGGSW